MTLILVLALPVFLAGATIGILAVLVIGIRRDDRAKNLTNVPGARLEAETRRALGVGVRNERAEHEEEWR
jgi:uncharacterized membrane protein